MTDKMISPKGVLEEQLKEAGTKLVQPPSSLDELLPLLDQIENLLARVEQSPALSMQAALSSLTSALVMDELLRHSDVDVKVAVASCISEITRITAPDAPYDDDKMKDVFQLIVSSFEDLSNVSSRSFNKRAMILETVARVRSCVVMLDLECDGLIAEMFTLFLKTIRDHHPENIFSSMETIMTLVLEESEDISLEILTPLLYSVKKDNQEVLPVAVKLAEKVFGNCVTKLKPCLSQAIKSLGASLDDYCEIVAAVCGEPHLTVEQMNENASTDQLAVKNINETNSQAVNHNVNGPPNSMDINGGNDKGDNRDTGVKVGSFSNAKEHHDLDNELSADKLASKSEDDDSETHKPLDFESKLEDVDTVRGRKPNSSMDGSESSGTSLVDGERAVEKQSDSQEVQEKQLHSSTREDMAVDASESFEKETVKNLSSPKASETDVANTASPSLSGSLKDESHPENAGRLKKKESSVQEETPSDFVSNKAYEGTHDSKAKQHRRTGKKAPAHATKKDNILADVDTSRNESVGASDSQKKQMKQLGKKVDESSNTEDGYSLKRNTDDNKRRHGKATAESEVTKSSADDDLKKTSSMKSPTKLANDECSSEETTRLSSKRELSKSNQSNLEYGDNLVGTKVKVWWPRDREFYEGVIDSFDPVRKKHKVSYYDGDMEILNLKRERWEIVDDGSFSSDGQATETESAEAASGMQKREKAETNSESLVKQWKSEGLPKSGAGSSNKSKGTVTKLGRKSAYDLKLKERILKSGGKSEDDSPRSKSHSQRLGDKHADHPSKTSLKSIADDSGTSTAKSKQDSPRTSNKSRQDIPRIGGKSKQDASKIKSKSKTLQVGDDGNANGVGKIKHNSTKTKEMRDLKEKIKEKPSVVPKTPERVKVKSSDMSKAQENETGSTKKRRRAG